MSIDAEGVDALILEGMRESSRGEGCLDSAF